ncbi:MAG: N-acetylmuramoyl-L-alanine amidase, partial [Acidobacteriaceae bacterium]|nr:N-acetylmuramoyl-L-alanine amidase [Acidobacteriaceae bacterium]
MASVFAVLCCAPAAASGQRRSDLAQWEKATKAREVLKAIPEARRTRADYNRALDSYRAVYHRSPKSVYAPDAVYAVAELLAEQGRVLHDRKSLKDAIGQYEFLRKQYPRSSLRAPALLAEAQINQNGLHDAAAARERYTLFLKQYPRSSLAEEAQAGLNSLR